MCLGHPSPDIPSSRECGKRFGPGCGFGCFKRVKYPERVRGIFTGKSPRPAPVTETEAWKQAGELAAGPALPVAAANR